MIVKYLCQCSTTAIDSEACCSTISVLLYSDTTQYNEITFPLLLVVHCANAETDFV